MIYTYSQRDQGRMEEGAISYSTFNAEGVIAAG